MPVWLKEKLLLKSVLQDELVSLDGVKKSGLPPILFGEHHESRALVFYERTKKILAPADHHLSCPARHSRGLHIRLRRRALHLHTLLDRKQ